MFQDPSHLLSFIRWINHVQSHVTHEVVEPETDVHRADKDALCRITSSPVKNLSLLHSSGIVTDHDLSSWQWIAQIEEVAATVLFRYIAPFVCGVVSDACLYAHIARISCSNGSIVFDLPSKSPGMSFLATSSRFDIHPPLQVPQTSGVRTHLESFQ